MTSGVAAPTPKIDGDGGGVPQQQHDAQYAGVTAPAIDQQSDGYRYFQNRHHAGDAPARERGHQFIGRVGLVEPAQVAQLVHAGARE